MTDDTPRPVKPYDPGVEITGAPSGAEVLRGAKDLEEKAARLAGKEETPKHPRWLRKLRTSALAGGVGSGLTAALGYVSPSVLASVGIANPWVAAALMAGVTAVQGVVGYYTKSDPRDFPKAEAMPAEEVRRLLEAEGSKETDSSIQSVPKPKPTSPSVMPTKNQSAPAASETKTSAREEALSIFDDEGDAEAFGRLVDGLADLPSALESFDDMAAEKLYQLAVNALDADPSK